LLSQVLELLQLLGLNQFDKNCNPNLTKEEVELLEGGVKICEMVQELITIMTNPIPVTTVPSSPSPPPANPGAVAAVTTATNAVTAAKDKEVKDAATAASAANTATAISALVTLVAVPLSTTPPGGISSNSGPSLLRAQSLLLPNGSPSIGDTPSSTSLPGTTSTSAVVAAMAAATSAATAATSPSSGTTLTTAPKPNDTSATAANTTTTATAPVTVNSVPTGEYGVLTPLYGKILECLKARKRSLKLLRRFIDKSDQTAISGVIIEGVLFTLAWKECYFQLTPSSLNIARGTKWKTGDKWQAQISLSNISLHNIANVPKQSVVAAAAASPTNTTSSTGSAPTTVSDSPANPPATSPTTSSSSSSSMKGVFVDETAELIANIHGLPNANVASSVIAHVSAYPNAWQISTTKESHIISAPTSELKSEWLRLLSQAVSRTRMESGKIGGGLFGMVGDLSTNLTVRTSTNFVCCVV
jgi:hypothetical protein